MTDNGYILQLSGWENFFTAIEHHWFTACMVAVALIFIANALSPTIYNKITTKDKEDKDE